MQISFTRIFALLCCLLFSLHAEYITPKYKLKMKISKQNILLGESVILSLELRYKELEDYTILEPVIEGISLKEISDDEYKTQEGDWVDTIKYKLTPQKEGSFKIIEQRAEIEFLSGDYKNFDNRHKYLQKRTISSNTLELSVVSLPKGVDVVGEYTLQTSISTNTVKAGEPILYTISLQGEGNLQDLDDLNLEIANVAMYEKTSLREKELYEKTFELVSDTSFVIPALSLKYFNTKTSRVEYLVSQAHEVLVDGKKVKEKVKKGLSMIEKVIYFAAGMFLVVLIWFIKKLLLWRQEKKKKPQFVKELQKIKDKELFLKKVVPFLDRDKKLDRLIYKLESIEDEKFLKLKKDIIQNIQKYIVK